MTCPVLRAGYCVQRAMGRRRDRDRFWIQQRRGEVCHADARRVSYRREGGARRGDMPTRELPARRRVSARVAADFVSADAPKSVDAMR